MLVLQKTNYTFTNLTQLSGLDFTSRLIIITEVTHV